MEDLNDLSRVHNDLRYGKALTFKAWLHEFRVFFFPFQARARTTIYVKLCDVCGETVANYFRFFPFAQSFIFFILFIFFFGIDVILCDAQRLLCGLSSRHICMSNAITAYIHIPHIVHCATAQHTLTLTTYLFY